MTRGLQVDALFTFLWHIHSAREWHNNRDQWFLIYLPERLCFHMCLFHRGEVYTPRRQTPPPRQTPTLGRHPPPPAPSRRPPQQTVRILLEYILVCRLFQDGDWNQEPMYPIVCQYCSLYRPRSRSRTV